MPFGAEQGLRRIVERLVAHGCPSFLAVLKRYGPGEGMLSFPTPGWTLALDIPAVLPGRGPLLDGLDEVVVDAGGRVYLAKDSRLGRAALRRMYPELDRWQTVRDRATRTAGSARTSPAASTSSDPPQPAQEHRAQRRRHRPGSPRPRGGSEIGQAIALRLVRDGAGMVVLAGRHPSAYAGAERALRDAGASTVASVVFDADDTGSHQGVVDGVVERYGDLDVAVVAFGVLDQAVAEHDPAAALAVIRTNLLGAVSALTVLAERVRTQGHRALVVLSSVAGERVRRSNFVYGASKAGLGAFATGLADALPGSGAHVLVVRPGFVVGRMTAGLPAAPLSTTPEAVAEVAVRGLAGTATVVWAPAPLRVVMSVARPVFRRLPL